MAKTWGNALAHPAVEFDATPLVVLEGVIPPDLRGTLYHNGPARLERGGQRVGHWFDGDGAILAVQFQDGRAVGTYRYVQTAGYQQEQGADRLLFGNYGMTHPGPLWQRWGKSLKNVANTAVLALDDRLLALWEGGLPHGLDRQTLSTHGLDLLGLQPQDSYSAHPKVDPHSGQIYNFGVSLGAQAQINLYRHDRQGHLLQRASIPLTGLGMPLIHDFVLAGDYLVVCIAPVRLNLWPAALQLRSFSESLEWKPQLGTEVVVIDRHSLTLVSRRTADPWFQWHYSNGWVNGAGHVVLDLVRYEDFQTNQYLKEVATGQVNTVVLGNLWRMVLDPTTAQILDSQPLTTGGVEFPQVSPQAVGQAPGGADDRGTVFVHHRPHQDAQGELFGAIGHLDPSGQVTVTDLGGDRYPFEPIWADRWVLTVVFNGSTGQSEVWVWDGDRPGSDPHCRLHLPQIIPLGFHGTWAALT